MSTVREMSEEYLKTAYELCVFLRLHSHAALGERIMTAAVEISALSHTTWAYYGKDGFIDNLVKTYEMAEKLMHLIGIAEYLELNYAGFEKVKQDTEAIYKMSKSSVNTLHQKMSKKDDNKGKNKAESEDVRPTRQLKEQNEQEKENEVQTEEETSAEAPLPFEANGENEENEEQKESA